MKRNLFVQDHPLPLYEVIGVNLINRNCLADIDLNLLSKSSREIELEDLDFVFKDDIELILLSRSS